MLSIHEAPPCEEPKDLHRSTSSSSVVVVAHVCNFHSCLFRFFLCFRDHIPPGPEKHLSFFRNEITTFLGHAMIDQTRCVFRELYTRHRAQAQSSNKRQFFSYTYDRNWSLSQPSTHQSCTPYMTLRLPQLQRLQPIHALQFHVGSHAES